METSRLRLIMDGKIQQNSLRYMRNEGDDCLCRA